MTRPRRRTLAAGLAALALAAGCASWNWRATGEAAVLSLCRAQSGGCWETRGPFPPPAPPAPRP